MDFRLVHRLSEQIARSSAGAGSCLGLLCLTLALVAPAMADCGAPSGGGRVVGVDERLDVAMQDGRLVRLGGLDVPNPARGSPELAEAARHFLAALLVGRDIELRLLAAGTDRWGRALADISILAPDRGAETSVAAALLAAGYARVRPEFEARACAAARLALEDGARGAGLGLWSDPDTAVIQASDADALRRHDGQFVVVEGRVRRVGIGRSRLYLDLVNRDGPTIVIERRFESALARAGRPVQALVGETIRTRGALDDRMAPRIEVSEPAMIEIVRRADSAGAEKPSR